MNDQQLASFGHIPLNEETLSQMDALERAFWDEFLPKVMSAFSAEEEKDSSRPFAFPDNLLPDFNKAITVYSGDKYCQISQIREIFDLPTSQ